MHLTSGLNCLHHRISSVVLISPYAMLCLSVCCIVFKPNADAISRAHCWVWPTFSLLEGLECDAKAQSPSLMLNSRHRQDVSRFRSNWAPVSGTMETWFSFLRAKQDNNSLRHQFAKVSRSIFERGEMLLEAKERGKELSWIAGFPESWGENAGNNLLSAINQLKRFKLEFFSQTHLTLWRTSQCTA